jgi:hypothetical protein
MESEPEAIAADSQRQFATRCPNTPKAILSMQSSASPKDHPPPRNQAPALLIDDLRLIIYDFRIGNWEVPNVSGFKCFSMRRPPDGAACPSVASREGGCDHPSKLDSSLESCFSKFPQINFQINIKTKPQITNTLVLSLVFGF